MQTGFLKVHKEASSRLQDISVKIKNLNHLSSALRIYECREHVT